MGKDAPQGSLNKLQKEQDKLIDTSSNPSGTYHNYQSINIKQLIQMENCKMGHKVQTKNIPTKVAEAIVNDQMG